MGGGPNGIGGSSNPYQLRLNQQTPAVRQTPQAAQTPQVEENHASQESHQSPETHETHQTEHTEGGHQEGHHGTSLLLRPNTSLRTDFGNVFSQTGFNIGGTGSFGKIHWEAYASPNLQLGTNGTALGLGGGAHLERLFGEHNQGLFIGALGHGQYSIPLSSNESHGEPHVDESHGDSHVDDSHGETPAAEGHSEDHGGSHGPGGVHLETSLQLGYQWSLGGHNGSALRAYVAPGAEYGHGSGNPTIGGGVEYRNNDFRVGLDTKLNPLQGANLTPQVGLTFTWTPFH